MTGLADSFDPNANNDCLFHRGAGGRQDFAGGIFTSIGGQTRNLFARLTNDTAALQNLAVTQTTITWMRGGSSPQFTRVTFESSSDNVNYTPLGNGTSAGSNWTLTGLSLPTGQNILHPRPRLLSQRQQQQLGEQRGNGAERVYHPAAQHPARLSRESCTTAWRSTLLFRSPATPGSNAAAAERPMITMLVFTFPSAVTCG